MEATRRKHRIRMLLTVGVVMVVVGTASAAFADHTPCADEPPVGVSPQVHVSPEDSRVYVFGVIFAGADANGGAAATSQGSVTFCVVQGNHQIYGTRTVTTTNTATPGKKVSSTGTSNLTLIPVGNTGGEVGTVSGTKVSGTTVYGNGQTLIGLQTIGANQSVHAPTLTQGTGFTCVSIVCVRDFTVSAGSVTVYANNNTGIPVVLCRQQGATAPACA